MHLTHCSPCISSYQQLDMMTLSYSNLKVVFFFLQFNFWQAQNSVVIAVIIKDSYVVTLISERVYFNLEL